MKRKPMSKKNSRRSFTANSGVHKANLNPRKMRGGIRF